MRAALLFVGLLLFVPAIVAQDPPSAPDLCGPITAAAVAPAPIAPGEQAEVTVTVTNEGELPASVTVAMLVDTPGWTSVSGDQSATIAKDATSDFRFIVSATEDAAGDARATFTAGGTCEAPGAVLCPEQACTLRDITTSTTIGYRAPEGLDIPFLKDLEIQPEILIAALVLIALVTAILILARRAPKALSAECAEPLKLVRPGRGTSFPVSVRNPSQETLVAQLEVGAVPEGWSAFMPLPDIQLAPRESRNLFLMVRAPETASDGDTVDVELAVRNAARPEKVSYVRMRAEVEPGTGGVRPA
jgi:hypothetical protein